MADTWFAIQQIRSIEYKVIFAKPYLHSFIVEDKNAEETRTMSQTHRG